MANDSLERWREHKRASAHDYDRKVELTQSGIPCPTTQQIGCKLVEVRDATMISLLGAYQFSGVAFTLDQLKGFERWFPTDEPEPENALQEAGSRRNLLRHVQEHGLRVMGFLAGRRLLEPGKDPVLTLAEMLEEYLEEPVIDLAEEDV